MQSTFLGIEGQTWIEMAVGLFLEGLLLGLIFQWLQNKQQKKSDKSMQDHLKQEDSKMQKLEKKQDGQHKENMQQLRDLQAEVHKLSAGISYAQQAHTEGTVAERVPDELKGTISEMLKKQAEKDGDFKAAEYFANEVRKAKRGDQ